MHESVFADVQVSGSRTAAPIVRFAAREIFLKPIQPAVALLSGVLDLSINALFATVQWFNCAAAVVNDPDRA